MILNSFLVAVSVAQAFGFEFLTGNGGKRLLVVSMDAFRHDFVSRGITPNINKIREKSTRSELYNVFPTITFPNYYTIATGLYPEDHGVIANLIYDKDTGKVINENDYKFWHYNQKIVPIWTLNEMQGGVSGSVMWPGGHFEYNGRNITYRVPYNEKTDFQERIDTAISYLKAPNPANLVLLYFQEPDSTAHTYGPNSPKTDEKIQKMDLYFKSIMDCLRSNGLEDVNVIFLSDHGMEEVTRDHIMKLEDWIGDKASQYGYSPVLQIYPKPNLENEVYSILKTKSKNGHFKVYKKSEIPDRFRYKNNERVPPILAVAEPKWAFYDEWHHWYDSEHDVNNKTALGVHGYDPKTKNMHPIFFAYGPAFRQNHDTSLKTVQMFELFARILGLDISSVNKIVK